MDLTKDYLDKCRELTNTVEAQKDKIITAAAWFGKSILSGRVVHVFGSGHSRMMVEEMWPRYGSFPKFNPIVELSLTFHNPVVGSNGQRQAMFLENVPGLAERILRNFSLSELDSALVISSSGCNVVPIEMAEVFKRNNIKVVSIITKKHSEANQSKRTDGKKLSDFSDLVLDTGAPDGDAMVHVPPLEIPVSPGSTIGGAMIVNCIKAEVARVLTENGQPPKVLCSASIAGKDQATRIFEAAYDEHGERLSRLLSHH